MILRLCELRAWRAAELAKVLGLGDPQKLVERHLGPLCDEHLLERVYPERLSHPDQAYRAVQRSL